MSKPNVCRLVWDYPTEGKAKYGLQPVFVNLSREQVKQGYEVHVIAPGSASKGKQEEDRGVVIHRVMRPFGLSAYRELSELVSEREWIVHSHATSGFIPSIIGRSDRFRHAVQVHGVSVRSPGGSNMTFGNLAQRTRERISWRRSDLVLTVCNSVSNDLCSYYGINPSKIKTVYNGVDEKLFRNLPYAHPLMALNDKRYILYVGHFGRRKGVTNLIRAMKRVKAECKEAHLLCIGGVPGWVNEPLALGNLRREIEANGVSSCVSLMDAIPNADLVPFYSRASVFALPSYYEAFPKAVLEAMSCSKPIVASNAGGIPEMVQDGKNGQLVRFGDVRALADSILCLLSNDDLARRMGNHSREIVLEKFTWEKVVARIGVAYTAIANHI